MPGLDKTGPVGLGSQTGRKRGQCSGESDSTVECTPRGRGRMGRGFGNRRNQDSDTVQGFGRGKRRGFGRGQAQGNN